jgi:hypothetical protein
VLAHDGCTTVSAAPGITAALLGNEIIPIATLPGSEGGSIWPPRPV